MAKIGLVRDMHALFLIMDIIAFLIYWNTKLKYCIILMLEKRLSKKSYILLMEVIL